MRFGDGDSDGCFLVLSLFVALMLSFITPPWLRVDVGVDDMGLEAAAAIDVADSFCTVDSTGGEKEGGGFQGIVGGKLPFRRGQKIHRELSEFYGRLSVFSLKSRRMAHTVNGREQILMY